MITADIGQQCLVATPIWLIKQLRLPLLSGLKPRTEPRLWLGSGALRIALAARPHARRAATPTLGATPQRGVFLNDCGSGLATKAGGRVRRERGLAAITMVDAPLPRQRRGVVRGEGPEKTSAGAAFQIIHLAYVFLMQRNKGELL